MNAERTGLLAGDTVILRCPQTHPKPSYLQEFWFSVLYGFSEKWGPRKASALRMSVHAAGELAKYLRRSDIYPTTIDIVAVGKL